MGPIETDLLITKWYMDIYTDQFRKLHIWDPQSVKVYRKSGRVNYPQKIWD